MGEGRGKEREGGERMYMYMHNTLLLSTVS